MMKKNEKKLLLYFEIFLLILYFVIDLGIYLNHFISDSFLSAISLRLTLWPLHLNCLQNFVWPIFIGYTILLFSFPIISLIKNRTRYIYLDIPLILCIIFNIYFFLSVISGFANL